MTTIAMRLSLKIRWEVYDSHHGFPSDLQHAVLTLLNAANSDEAESAYWGLENRVVVQGNVYSAAVPVTMVLTASLLDTPPLPVRIAILDLFFQILSGTSVDSAKDFVCECREFMNRGYWLIYREFVQGPRSAAGDVLEKLNLNFDYNLLVEP